MIEPKLLQKSGGSLEWPPKVNVKERKQSSFCFTPQEPLRVLWHLEALASTEIQQTQLLFLLQH